MNKKGIGTGQMTSRFSVRNKNTITKNKHDKGNEETISNVERRI